MKQKFKIVMWALIVLMTVAVVVVFKYKSPEKINAPELQDSKEQKGGAEAKASKEVKGGKGGRVVPVKVIVADFEVIEGGRPILGTLLPNEEVDIASEISGKIERIGFMEGEFVKKGTILVKVNDEDLRSQLKRAVYQRDMLKDKLERNRILLAKDAISRESFDQIETDYNMVEADIQLLNVKIAKTEIRAPFDGVIGFRHVSPGSYVQPSTLIARIADYSTLKLEFSVPEKYYQTISKGSNISFTVSSSTKVNRARVYAIDPMVDSKTRTINMRALYSNSDRKYLPGMSANLTVGQKKGSEILVPSVAVIPEADGMKIWTVENGKAVSTSVTTGTRRESSVEITYGLSKGDTIIVSGILQVREGASVQVVNE